MFGIALWDSKRRRLVLARDRVGIKPLYYWATPGGIAFASELRSFLVLDQFPRRIDPNAIARYLSLGYIPDPWCVFEGVRKLPPGHILEWNAESGIRTEQYWSPVGPENTHLDERTATEELRRMLLAEVGSHLESEVPLGAFLSGGIDLSVGSLISLAACLTSGLINGDPGRVVAVVAAVLLLGTFVGVLNAGLVIGLRVHPLIVTLGMGAMLQGVTLLYAMGPVGKVPRTFTFLAYGRIAGLPLGATIAVMLCVVVALFLRYLPL